LTSVVRSPGAVEADREGAYLGTADEILLSGPLDEVLADRIRTVRAEARARKGWIMDTYLLRRADER
jgi:precorrin-6A synthase